MTYTKINIPSCTNCEHKKEGVSIFCSLDINEIENISEYKRNISFKKGQVIFSEGNQPHGIYCIYKGKVKIHKMGDEGKDQIVRLAKASNIVGYRSIFNNDVYYASATAIEDTDVCFISKNFITELIKTNNCFAFSMMNILSDDLKRAEEKITHMAQKHVRERMAEALLLLNEAYGFKADGITIDSALTRREIANIAGTTTETSIRILSDFDKEKLIELKGKDIKLLDIKKLLRIANVFD
ncbi:MAG: Crp/Fnr family transcriptional regulator [Bacteroidetes bacterium HGW-Bacteroidetes-12]|nr:MAG: Crp/Fnr family transcriptional regulator [Bacteroidetes bacterium HGW-Bacteroidetes-12]